jgi:hypothetical protein
MTWRYKSEAAGVLHMGPMSQDFRGAFGLGADDRAIGTVDADGVAFAAIQGLSDELKDRDKKIAGLEERLGRQQALIDGLKGIVCAQNPAADLCR